MAKTITRVSAATKVWKMVSHRAGDPTAMLAAIHAAAAPMTSTTAGGRDACRSTLGSQRLWQNALQAARTRSRNPPLSC
jgi:hypothetical protein